MVKLISNYSSITLISNLGISNDHTCVLKYVLRFDNNKGDHKLDYKTLCELLIL